jgi:hypothetical protein
MLIAIAGSFYYFDRQFVPWPQMVVPSGVVSAGSCDHFITLYERQSGWHGKICLREGTWQSMQMGTMVEGVGRRSALGRTVERLER